MFWNPFKRHHITPVLPTDVDAAPAMDVDTHNQIEFERLRKRQARRQIENIYEQLAEQALCKMKGGGTCPD